MTCNVNLMKMLGLNTASSSGIFNCNYAGSSFTNSIFGCGGEIDYGAEAGLACINIFGQMGMMALGGVIQRYASGGGGGLTEQGAPEVKAEGQEYGSSKDVQKRIDEIDKIVPQSKIPEQKYTDAITTASQAIQGANKSIEGLNESIEGLNKSIGDKERLIQSGKDTSGNALTEARINQIKGEIATLQAQLKAKTEEKAKLEADVKEDGKLGKALKEAQGAYATRQGEINELLNEKTQLIQLKKQLEFQEQLSKFDGNQLTRLNSSKDEIENKLDNKDENYGKFDKYDLQEALYQYGQAVKKGQSGEADNWLTTIFKITPHLTEDEVGKSMVSFVEALAQKNNMKFAFKPVGS